MHCSGEDKVSNEESDEETESEESSDDDEESDEEDFDDSVCPPGCDQALYDLAIKMREQRLDLEEALTGEECCTSNSLVLIVTFQMNERAKRL